MKKLYLLITIVFILSVVGCEGSGTDSQSHVISSSDLTDREKTILHTTSDGSFVFDYTIDDAYDAVAVWLEKYDSGELVDDQFGLLTSAINKSEGTIMFARSRADDDQEYPTFQIGAGDADRMSVSFFSDQDLEKAHNVSMMSSQLPDEQSFDGEAVTLGTMAFSGNDSNTLSISTDFYEDPEAHMDELEDYNTVYVLKAEFRK